MREPVLCPLCGSTRDFSHPLRLDVAVRGLFEAALNCTNGHQAQAADLLGISPRVMTYQMQRLGIPTKRSRPHANRRYPKPPASY